MAVPETHEDQDDIYDQLQGPEVAEDNVPPLEQQAAPHHYPDRQRHRPK